ncbi:MAG: type II toxin-antitoxin system RelE/ParE family toxin [Prochlorococcaceae cyanobacterium]
MIRSFRGADTKALAEGVRVPRFIATTLQDLRIPPGNRRGQHSIRINSQWRICFTWSEAGPEGVEIVDYH